MRRKIFSKIIAVLLLMSSSLGTYSYADSMNKEAILFKSVEITDPEEILSRMENGITDSDIKELITVGFKNDNISDKANVIENTSKDIFAIDSMSTTQKLKSTVDSSGGITDEYVAHVMVMIDNNESIISTMGTGSGSEDDEDGDSNTGAVLYLKAYYNYYSDPLGGAYFTFSSVKSKVTRYDSALTLSNLVIKNNKMGDLYLDKYGDVSYDSRYDYNTKTVSVPSSGTYYYCYDADETYVLLNGTSALDGIANAYSEVTIKRGSSSWKLSVIITKELI